MNSNRKAFVRPDWKIWSPRLEPLPKVPPVTWRISICTVCMRRTRDLRETLVKNIEENSDYPNLEFVVLNYNSDDDLDAFMLSESIAPYLRIGRVRYLITREPKFYATSHSRNVAFNNSTGEIVTNVDADNYTGRGFASYLNRLANIRQHKVLFTRSKWRNHGRIGMFKSDFYELGGYDEDLSGYGWEDYSLMGRALSGGFTLMWWLRRDVDYSRRIITPKCDVASNMSNQEWRQTEQSNKEITLKKIANGDLTANRFRRWGYVGDLQVYGASLGSR